MDHSAITNGRPRHLGPSAPAEVGHYQERVRSTMSDLLLAEERERRQLASDLHDGLSQTLALIAMKISALQKVAGVEFETRLGEILDLVDQANTAARTIGYELSPPVLHDVGLEPAVRWLVDNIRSRYGIAIDYTDDAHAKPTDERTRVVLFRSIRELLINAAKHSNAGRVNVGLTRDGAAIVAVVVDDGVGMDDSFTGAPGSGLFGIRERIEHVGGSIELQSEPGQGTRVRLSAPCLGDAADLVRRDS